MASVTRFSRVGSGVCGKIPLSDDPRWWTIRSPSSALAPLVPEAFTESTTHLIDCHRRSSTHPIAFSASRTRSTWMCAASGTNPSAEPPPGALTEIDPTRSTPTPAAPLLSAARYREMISSANPFEGAAASAFRALGTEHWALPPTMTLTPFHSCGLWLAVTTIPPTAPRTSHITPIVGVIATPHSSTSHPAAASPAAHARMSTSPPTRPIPPQNTRGPPIPPPPPPAGEVSERSDDGGGIPCPARSTNHPPTTIANRAATSGVIVFPKIPRHPDTESISGALIPATDAEVGGVDLGPMGECALIFVPDDCTVPPPGHSITSPERPMPPRPHLVAAVSLLASLGAAAHAQTVQFRIVERTGQTIFTPTDPVLDLAVQGRIVGGSADACIAGFAFDMVMPGEPDAGGTLTRGLINNLDHT